MIRTIFFVIAHVLTTTVLGILVLLVSLFDVRGRLIVRIVRLWARILMAASGVRYRVKGLEQLDPTGNYFFACNHESSLDIPLTLGGLPFHIVIVAKAELKKVPIMGWAMSRAKYVFVDRRDLRRAAEAIEKAKESLRKYPRSVLIYPEGTRTTDGNVQRFKKGGLGLAVDLGMPVVPVAVCGTGRVIPPHSIYIKKGEVELRVGRPMDTRLWREKDRTEFTRVVREKVVELREAWISQGMEPVREELG